ncbi:MAG: hypothetical protein ABJC74_05515, partial [Gemmatimonadota bacterium]
TRLRYKPAVLDPEQLENELAELQDQLKALDRASPTMVQAQMIEALTMDLVALEAAIRRQRSAAIQGVLQLGD